MNLIRELKCGLQSRGHCWHYAGPEITVRTRHDFEKWTEKLKMCDECGATRIERGHYVRIPKPGQGSRTRTADAEREERWLPCPSVGCHD